MIHLPNPGSAVRADCSTALIFRDEGLFAAHACFRLFGEFHETANRGSCDGDGAGVCSCKQRVGFCFPEDRLKDTAERFGELVVEIVFCVNGHVVLEDEDGIFGSFEVLGACRAFDNHVGYSITERGR